MGLLGNTLRMPGPLESATQLLPPEAPAVHPDAAGLLFAYPTPEAAQAYVNTQADPELYNVIPHPGGAGFAAAPKVGLDRARVLYQRRVAEANGLNSLRTEQLAAEEQPPAEILAAVPEATSANRPASFDPEAAAQAASAQAAQDELAPAPVQLSPRCLAFNSGPRRKPQRPTKRTRYARNNSQPRSPRER